MEALAELDWVVVIESVLVVALAVAAVTKTEKDNTVLERVKGIWDSWRRK